MMVTRSITEAVDQEVPVDLIPTDAERAAETFLDGKQTTTSSIPLSEESSTQNSLAAVTTAIKYDSEGLIYVAGEEGTLNIDNDGVQTPTASSGALTPLQSTKRSEGWQPCLSDETAPNFSFAPALSVSVPEQNDVVASIIADAIELGHSEQEEVSNVVKGNADATVKTTSVNHGLGTLANESGEELMAFGADDNVESAMPSAAPSGALKPSRSTKRADRRQVSFSKEAMQKFSSAPAEWESLPEQVHIVASTVADAMELGNSHPEQEKFHDAIENNKGLCIDTGLATGRERGVRYHKALVRSNTACAPRSKKERVSRDVMKFFGFHHTMEDDDAEAHAEEQQISTHGRFMVSSQDIHEQRANNALEHKKQYRLKTIPPPSKQRRLLKWLGVAESLLIFEDDNGNDSCEICGVKLNQLVMRYIHWAFRRSFIAVFMSLAACYVIVIFWFTIAIYAVSRRRPECIVGVTPPDTDDYDGPAGGFFMDAFQLSWQTFATVGYGIVAADIASDPKGCVEMSIIVSLEGFAGLCFVSFCGAIIFAKVARIQSFAQVTFSDPMVLRYGNGLNVECSNDKDDPCNDDAVSDESSELFLECSARIPCPVLEFRINNNLHSITGGEIMDASVNIVASIDSCQACPTLKPVRKHRGGKGKKGSRHSTTTVTRRHLQRIEPGLEDPNSNHTLSADESVTRSGSLDALFSVVRPGQEIEEDPSGRLVPKRIFAKLDLETADHPFFKRVWTVRHTIDEASPLLMAHARRMVRLNQGYWPRQLNSYEKVKEAIRFDQVLVSFSGTSNAAANAVYAQKAYDYEDVCVGYQFVNQTYRDKRDDNLHLDTRLINDIMEQNGGGGAPLSCDEHDSHGASPDVIMML